MMIFGDFSMYIHDTPSKKFVNDFKKVFTKIMRYAILLLKERLIKNAD
jgi:hypothetical protein